MSTRQERERVIVDARVTGRDPREALKEHEERKVEERKQARAAEHPASAVSYVNVTFDMPVATMELANLIVDKINDEIVAAHGMRMLSATVIDASGTVCVWNPLAEEPSDLAPVPYAVERNAAEEFLLDAEAVARNADEEFLRDERSSQEMT